MSQLPSTDQNKEKVENTKNESKTEEEEDSASNIEDLLDGILEDEETEKKTRPDYTGKWEMEENVNVEKFAEEIGLR